MRPRRRAVRVGATSRDAWSNTVLLVVAMASIPTANGT